MDCSPPGSSVWFSRQEYLSGLPFPSPGDLPYPGIKPASPALAGRFFTPSATREAHMGVISSSSCRNPMKELLLFCGCYNNPMAWTNRNALSQVLESRSPKSKCLKCWFLLEALRKRMRILWPLRKKVFILCFSLLPAIFEDPWPEDIKLWSLSPASNDILLCMSLCLPLFFLL